MKACVRCTWSRCLDTPAPGPKLRLDFSMESREGWSACPQREIAVNPIRLPASQTLRSLATGSTVVGARAEMSAGAGSALACVPSRPVLCVGASSRPARLACVQSRPVRCVGASSRPVRSVGVPSRPLHLATLQSGALRV